MKKTSTWFVWKKAYRTISKNKGKTIPIMVLIVFAVAFGMVLGDMMKLEAEIATQAVDQTNFPDAAAYFNPMMVNTSEDLLDDDVFQYLDNYEFRMMLSINFKIKGEQYEGFLVGVDNSKDEHVFALINEENEELDDYHKVLEYNFANQNGVTKGEDITLIYGTEEMTQEIDNIAYSSEFQFIPLDSVSGFPSFKPYPIFYVGYDFINEEFFGEEKPLVNKFIYTLKDKDDAQKVEDLIEENLGGSLQRIVPKEDFPLIKTFEEGMDQSTTMVNMLTGIMMAGAIITLILIVHKLIEEDLKTVSVFQALGANKREILLSYLALNVIMVSIGLGGGIVLGYLIKIPLMDMVAMMLGTPLQLTIPFNWANAALYGVILFAVSLFATYIIVKKTFKMDVRQTMRYETKHFEKLNIIERLYIKFKSNPHPFTKYNLRRIFGRKLHLGSLIIALSFSASLMVYTFAITDSINYSLNRKFSEVELWDCVANTWQYEDADNLTDNLNSIDHIKDIEFGISDSIQYSKDEKNFDEMFAISAYQKDSELHNLFVESGEMFEEDDEILVSKDIPSSYEINIGDKLYVKGAGIDKSYKVKVTGIVNDLVGQTIFTSLKTAQMILNETDNVNSVYFTVEEGKIDEVAENVEGLSEVEDVAKLSSIKSDIDYILQITSVEMAIFGALFMGFGMVLLLIIYKSIVDYRMEDYSNMKAVGIYNKEIRKSLIFELGVYFFISALAGFYLGQLWVSDMIDTMATTLMPGLYYRLNTISYFYYAITLVAILLFSFLYNYRRVKKMDIAENMRSKTFG